MAIIKRPRRKSSSATVYCLVSAFLIIALFLFGISFFTRVDIIEVTGAMKYTNREIIEASEFEIGNNLILINTELAEFRIQTLLPHISEVVITPVFPNKITIEVTESSPIGIIRHRNGILVVDSNVRVVDIFSPDEVIPYGLIEIRGFAPSRADLGSKVRVDLINESQLQYLEDILHVIEQEGFIGYITYVDVSNIANISFDYTERYRVILDSPNNIAQNMGILRDAITENERDGRILPGVRGTIRVSDARGEFTFHEDR